MSATYLPTSEGELYPDAITPTLVGGYKDGELVWLPISIKAGGTSTQDSQRITTIEANIVTINAEIDALQEGSSVVRKSFFSTTRGIDYQDYFLLKTGGSISADISHTTNGPANFWFAGDSQVIPHDPEVAHFYRANALSGQIVWWLDEATNTRQYAKCVSASLVQKQTLPPDSTGGWLIGALDEL